MERFSLKLPSPGALPSAMAAWEQDVAAETVESEETSEAQETVEQVETRCDPQL